MTVSAGKDAFIETGFSRDEKGTPPRSYCPVFVVGCHRSGTNLLYDMLLSAGGFAIYRGYLPVYKMLLPKLGSFENAETRKKLMAVWARSKGFRRSGWDVAELAEKVERECRSGGDFMRITMDGIARQQGVARWAVYDPDNLLHIPRIKRDIPEALFLHIIRDGRDIALSLKKMGGFRPLPWDRGERSLAATAMYWEWMVRKGRLHGRKIPADYMEVHYEDLVCEPERVLTNVGQFLDHNLDYGRIQSAALGRLRESNSSFKDEKSNFGKPLKRWQARLSRDEVASLESLVGDCLREFGYQLSSSEAERAQYSSAKWMRLTYPTYLNSKLWLKTRTPLGRFSDLSEMELQDGISETAVN